MTYKHHDKVNNSQDPEHLIDAAFAQILKQSLHDRACDSLSCTEACNSQTGSQTFSVLEPEHQSLNRRKITGAKTDTHDKAVAYINTNQGKYTSLVLATIINKEAGACHTQCKGDSSDQGRFVNVFLYNVSKECSGHAQKEYCEAECPFSGALGVADIVSDFLAENRPAVNSTDTTVQQKCRNSGTYPLVLTIFHDNPSYFLKY